MEEYRDWGWIRVLCLRALMPCIKLKSHSAANGQSLVDKNSDQPTSKGTLVFKMRRIARCGLVAVLYCNKCFALVAEHAASDEVQQPVAP
jgi:hypothetical protein